MDNRIKIKIEHKQNQGEYPSDKFWYPFQEAYRKALKRFSDNRNENTIDIHKFENNLERNLGSEIEYILVTHFNKPLNILDRPYRDIYREKGPYFSDDYRIELLKTDPAFRQAVHKTIIASQISVKAKIDGYGSLNLSLFIEPMEKLLNLFDNNFDLFRVFFESYIPEAFIDSLRDPDSGRVINEYNEIELSFQIEYPEVFRKRKPFIPIPKIMDNNGKINKSLWLAGLISSPMLFPFLIALAVLYFAYQNIEKANQIYINQNKIILEQKEEIIKNYKDLLHEIKIAKPKKDTIYINCTKK